MGLITTRKDNTGIRIMIDNMEIKVKYKGLNRNQCVLEIQAPREVLVLRDEVPYDASKNSSDGRRVGEQYCDATINKQSILRHSQAKPLLNNRS